MPANISIPGEQYQRRATEDRLWKQCVRHNILFWENEVATWERLSISFRVYVSDQALGNDETSFMWAAT